MLSYLDPILFPDQIEILEVSPGRYVYPIYKNGSGLLTDANDFRRLNYFEIRDIRTVEVFVRDPFDRYVSGVQTYLRFNPDLDRTTALKMINQCLFLNRHFALQFHWLVNLTRFTDAWIHIRPITELDTISDEVWHTLSRDQSLIDYFTPNDKLSYYLQLDKVLTEDLLGKTVSFLAITRHIKKTQQHLYDEIIQRSKNLCIALD